MEEFLNIIEEIRFLDPDDFYQRKEEIKTIYQSLDNNTKEVYKWYFYFQFCLLKNPLKEMLWTYLNGEENIFFLSDLEREYSNFCNRRKRQKQDEREIDNIWE